VSPSISGFGRFCCKKILRDRASNIDSRLGVFAQYLIQKSPRPASIVAHFGLSQIDQKRARIGTIATKFATGKMIHSIGSPRQRIFAQPRPPIADLTTCRVD
jgi:hypothetical protein